MLYATIFSAPETKAHVHYCDHALSFVRPSVVVNFSHCRLLLWNRWTEFNETWRNIFSGLIRKTRWPPWPIRQKGGTLYSGARYKALLGPLLSPSFAKAGDIKTHSSVRLSVCHKNWLISSEVLMIEHWYLACMILVTSPFYWYHAVTLTLTFYLLQGQICRARDHDSSNLLVLSWIYFVHWEITYSM